MLDKWSPRDAGNSLWTKLPVVVVVLDTVKDVSMITAPYMHKATC